MTDEFLPSSRYALLSTFSTKTPLGEFQSVQTLSFICDFVLKDPLLYITLTSFVPLFQNLELAVSTSNPAKYIQFLSTASIL